MALKPEDAVKAAANSLSDIGALSDTGAQSGSSSQSDASPQSPGERNDVTIVVCSTCRGPEGSDARPTPGETLGEAVRAANKGGDINVVAIECLGNCKRRLSAALVTSNCWTYVFGDLTLANAADLIEGARLMRDTTNGLMPWRDRPQCLKTGMVSRIPPIALTASPAPARVSPAPAKVSLTAAKTSK